MNLSLYSLSAIHTPTALYLDSFYTFKQSKRVYEQGFQLNQINALENIYDSSINNYTSQFLTGYKKLEDFIIPNSKRSRLRTITTPLILNTQLESLTPNVITISSAIDNTTSLSTTSTVDFSNNNSFFELEIVNDKFLRVLHNSGSGYYILNALGLDSVIFTTSSTTYTCGEETETSDIFRYQLDDSGNLLLYKYFDGILYIVGLTGNKLVLFDIQSRNYSSTNTLFKIYYNFEDITPKLRASWVSYIRTKLNTLKINNEKSNIDSNNQYLIHTNYNEIGNTFYINYCTLNNNRSEKGFVKRGTSTTIGNPNIPDTNFREYTTLQTGSDQELGDDHISMTYVWYDKDIEVLAGKDTYFTTPSSLYPYEKLNINDTKFTQNGSLAATTPLLADKVFCLRTTNQEFRSGRYLCTWLSGGTQTPGIWVDRYYYPDRVSKIEALSSITVYTPSFLDSIDKLSYPFKATDSYIFDKKSDLVLEPNTTYFYSRVGQGDIRGVLDSLTPLVSGVNNYYTTKNTLVPCDSQEIIYDGTKYNKYNIKNSVNCTTQFTVSFEFYVDPVTPVGYSFANADREFSIINDIRVTPFITLFQDNNVYLYNSDFVLIKTITFDSDVKEIIQGEPLDAFFVVCKGGDLYKVNSLGNKLKREFVSSQFVTYINFTQDSNYIYFLLNIQGSILKVNKITFNTELIVAIPPPKLYAEESVIRYRGLVIYNNVVYGVPGENVKYKSISDIYYLINNKQVWNYSFVTGRAQIVFDTRTSINDFEITDNDLITILTDRNWYTYTLNRAFVLSGTTIENTGNFKNIHIDTIREYTPNGLNTNLCVLMVLSGVDINTGNLYTRRIGSNTSTSLGISGKYIPDISATRRKYSMTNFNRLKNYSRNNLLFNITLTNYLSSEDIVQKRIEVDLNEIDEGYHIFTYRFDAVQGNISLFIDSNLYQNIAIPPGKYTIQQILKELLYIGSVGISNGQDLATVLRQPGYYYINNNRAVKNLLVYDRALKGIEISALNLINKPIDNLVLSLPYGQRNNIEEIERYFKYSPVTSSKSINIYVKDTGITNESLISNIKTSILDQARKALPVGVKINDIKFIDFNDTV
jgi:hypothetical protein